MMPITTKPIFNFVFLPDINRLRGIYVGRIWLQQCISYIRNNQHLPYLQLQTLSMKDLIYRYFLDSNLHDIYDETTGLSPHMKLLEASITSVPSSSVPTLATIPSPLAVSSRVILIDVLVVQCDEVVNIGSSAVQQDKGGHESTHASQRLLKLFLTDGKHNVRVCVRFCACVCVRVCILFLYCAYCATAIKSYSTFDCLFIAVCRY